MPFVTIKGFIQNKLAPQDFFEIEEKIEKIVKDFAHASAIIDWIFITDIFTRKKQNITCEIKYDPFPDLTYEVLQEMCGSITSLLQNYINHNEVTLRAFTQALDKMNEGYCSTSVCNNGVKDFVSTGENVYMKVFYSDDKMKRFRLAYLKKCFEQTEHLTKENPKKNPHYVAAESMYNA